MKRETYKRLVWIGLIFFLVMSYGGWHLRTSIEANNNRLITVADYKEMYRTAATANVDMNEVLDRLKQNGVSHVGVKESTLRDLEFQGDIALWSFGDFRALHQYSNPQVWKQAQTAIGSNIISPANLTAATSNPDVAAFLKNQLQSRYLPNQVVSFVSGSNSYFIVNAPSAILDKRKDVQPQLDAVLGYDPRILDQVSGKGFEIVLRPENNKGAGVDYLQEYETIAAHYNVKYVIFSNEVSGQPDHLQPMIDLINQHQLLLGIVETSEQLKYVEQPGLDQVMAATAYPVNRVYTTVNDDFVKTVDERYYRWVRAVVDRGIRILYVSPFKDTKLDASQNLDNTINTIGQFHATMASKGFVLNEELQRLPSHSTTAGHRTTVSISLLLAGTLYLLNLTRWRLPIISVIIVTGALLCVGINLFTGMDLTKVYALGAAVLYPALSSLLLLLYVRDHHGHPLWVQFLLGLAIVVGVNLLGAYTVIASLSDLRFIMNIKIFSGVKLAFFLPLLLFVVNYFSCFAGDESISLRMWKTLQEKPSYLILFLFMVAAAAGYYYLGRSGNNLGVGVSPLEIKIREILEMVFLARPRFKEIIIGYPALWAGIYLYNKYRQPFILFITGLAVVVGSISMVNSFCHVFTAAFISAQRSLAGLLVGSIIGLATVLCLWLLEIIIQRYFPDIVAEIKKS